jgi:hypothetical protein
MSGRKRSSWPVLLACGGLLAAAPPVRAQVHDGAKLFKPEAIQKADKQIEQIREMFGKGLVIESVYEAPPDRAKSANLKDAKQRKEFFDKWAQERIRALRVNGVYVLICLEPRHIEVTVTEGTEKLFTEWNQRQLHRLLVDKLQPDNPDQGGVQELFNKLRKKRSNDDGLLAAVHYVEAKLDWNRPVDQTNWLIGLGIIGGLLAFWMLLGLVRMRLRRRTPAGAGVREEDESGRSIAVLGGGIGAVSGEWLFDRVRSAGRRVRHGVAPQPAEAASGDSDTRLHLQDLPPEKSPPDEAMPGES